MSVGGNHTLLCATFEALLKVQASADLSQIRIERIHAGAGIYFGLARSGRTIFVVERNLDPDRVPRAPDAPTNAIRRYHLGWLGGGPRRTADTLVDRAFVDLHQITHDAGALFVTTGAPPFLLRHDPASGATHSLPVANAVPDDLRRDPSERVDTYHFNSVLVHDGRLQALAHNWDRPSFAVSCDLAAAREGRIEGVEVRRGVGSQCHDLVAVGDTLWSLNSDGSTLVRLDAGGAHREFPIPSPLGRTFPRGLARIGDRLAIAYGSWQSEREARATSPSRLCFFDLPRQDFVSDLDLGEHGNTCCLLPL